MMKEPCHSNDDWNIIVKITLSLTLMFKIVL